MLEMRDWLGCDGESILYEPDDIECPVCYTTYNSDEYEGDFLVCDEYGCRIYFDEYYE